MLKQYLNFKLSQKLSPQQIQLMKLIQLPTLAFEQKIQHEIEENPALENGKENLDEFEEFDQKDEYDEGERIDAEDINIDEYLSDDEIPSYKLQSNNYSESDDKQIPYAGGVSFHQYLANQLDTLLISEEELNLAKFLVGTIDGSGYLRRELDDILDDLAFTQNIFTEKEELLKVLELIHDLEPAGIGARNLRECLLIQLERKKTDRQSVLLALQIVKDAFENFSKKHFDKLITKFKCTEDELRDAIEEIGRLNPKPGSSYSENTKIVEHVIPDFIIKIEDNSLNLTLNGRNAPELHVSREYTEMLKGYKEAKSKSKSQKDAVQFIKQKLDGAKWFIEAIKQRQETLYVTMHTIMKYQENYFLSGDEKSIKPMILKDIADIIGMDISTVSRVANSKYVETPYGTKLIKELFSESMVNNEGEEISTKEVKSILKTVIEEEDKSKPLTDAKLSDLLQDKGYKIARRTVAKYREQLDYPVARLRKQI